MNWSLESTLQENLDVRMKLLHRIIEGIITLIPTAQSELYPILETEFPFKNVDVNIFKTYISQLLYICEYIPVLQSKIFGLIIRKSLEIDVEIFIEDNGEVKLREAEDFQRISQARNDLSDMFAIDDCNCNLMEMQQPHAKLIETNAHRIPVNVMELAERLDVILYRFIQFLKRKIEEFSSSPEMTTSSNRLFSALQQLFEDHILVTHRSKYVQFLLFFCCAKSPGFAMLFSRRLLLLFVDHNVPRTKRQYVVMYLASFVARANFLPLAVVRYIQCSQSLCLAFQTSFVVLLFFLSLCP